MPRRLPLLCLAAIPFLAPSSRADTLVDNFKSTGTLLSGASSFTLPGTPGSEQFPTTQSDIPIPGASRSFYGYPAGVDNFSGHNSLKISTGNGLDFTATGQSAGINLSYGLDDPQRSLLNLSFTSDSVLRFVFSDITNVGTTAPTLTLGFMHHISSPPSPPDVTPFLTFPTSPTFNSPSTAIQLTDFGFAGAYSANLVNGPQTIDVPLNELLPLSMNGHPFDTIDGISISLVSPNSTHIHLDSITLIDHPATSSAPEPAALTLLSLPLLLLRTKRRL